LSLDDRLREFVVEYGERACIVLKAIHEESSLGGRLKLGDFSIKGLKARLKSWGVEYNPTPLLLKLEKELNLIETSYRSTTQRWWRITNREALERALALCRGAPRSGDIEDPMVRLLRIQFHVLRPWEILETLRRIKAKDAMSRSDLELLKRIVFNELPLLIELKGKVESLGYDSELQEEVSVVERIIEIAEELVLRGSRRPEAPEIEVIASKEEPSYY
jgi:hypothetical protein